jgi:predicted N-acetyltransferase YhbS
MEKNTAEIKDRRASLPETVIREADRQDADLLVALGKRTFYKRWHFKVVDRQKFMVASDVQNDHIFRRDL